MLMPLLATVALALGLAPCVLQRACPSHRPRPPSTVCMHRIPSLRTDRLDRTSIRVSLSLCSVVAGLCDDRLRRRIFRGANKAGRGQLYARVELEALLRMPLAHVLLQVPLRISPDRLMSYTRALALLALVAITNQATTGCKNCIVLGKEEKAMFRAHSDACVSSSRVAPRLVEALLAGELLDEPALRRHVYCVLLKCKLVSKDGKLQKAAVLGKMAARPDAKNATKALESCSEQTGDTPEDLAWNLFRCGYDKKALLFEYMPTNGANEPESNS